MQHLSKVNDGVKNDIARQKRRGVHFKSILMFRKAEQLWAGRKRGSILTQVSGHQISIMEILHAQSNNVNEILDDLHELHCSRVDLEKIKRTKGHYQCFYYFLNVPVGLLGGKEENDRRRGEKIKKGKRDDFLLQLCFRPLAKGAR